MAKKNSGNYKIPQVYPVGYTDNSGVYHSCTFMGLANFPPSMLSLKAQEINAKFIQVCQDRTWIDKLGIEHRNSLSLDELKDVYANGVEWSGVRYYRLVRSAGEAKNGTCIFCDKDHVEEMKKFLTLGFETKKLVEMEAYSALASSTVIDSLPIKLSNIFFVDDWTTLKKEICNVFKTNSEGIGYMKTNVECEVESVAWDGQSLIDSSVLENGFACLRAPFFKTAALSCNIQQYFKDIGVQNRQLTDAFGRRVRLSSVKMITSLENCKFKKLGISFEKWARAYKEWGNCMTVVKKTHENKWGRDIVQISYQMYSTLSSSEASELINMNKEYISYFKNEGFIDYLKSQKNNIGHGITYEKYWDKIKDYKSAKEFKNNIIKYYPNDTSKEPHGMMTMIRKRAKLWVSGNNTTLFGSPMSMLHYVASGGQRKDFMNKHEYGYSVYTPSFEVGETLALMRSPYNSSSNSLLGWNDGYEWANKYFNLTKYEVIIDTIGTDLQARANGADMDSDFTLTTNCKPFVECCLRASIENKTVINGVEKVSKEYENNSDNLAEIDYNIHKGNIIIGKSADLACAHNLRGSIIEADGMAVLSQISVDSSKRSFKIEMADTYNAYRNLADGKKYHSGKTTKIAYYDKETLTRISESNATKESIVKTVTTYNEKDDSKYYGIRLDLLNETFDDCRVEYSLNKKYDKFEIPDDETIEKMDKFIKKYEDAMKNHEIFIPEGKFINSWKASNLTLWLLCSEDLSTKYKRNRTLLVDYIYKWFPAKVENAINKMAE